MRNAGIFVLASTTLRTCSGVLHNDNDDNNIKTKEQCIKRDDRVCAQLHFNICKEKGVQLDKKNNWYEHVPESVEKVQGGKVTMLWNEQVQTDRNLASNITDIIMRKSDVWLTVHRNSVWIRKTN